MMAVYNLRVGTATPVADASKGGTFNELEDEFANSLNVRPLLLGQLFLHTDRPHQGKSWKIAQDFRVPRSFDELSEKMCVFVIAGTPGGRALISDDSCPLEQIHSLWRTRELDHRPRRLDLSRIVVDDYL